ncbi:arsenate reductase (glutaredoxin) [Capnocytophaga cynodegmi]|uniref:arsenate reductase (glutaredoxin) n=1 Tax=Capnocytophaga cynodegmi TaxID=28189 RepID=UPI00385CE81A
MIKIYHNPRCSKSRCGLDLLKESEKEYEIVDYMKNPPKKEEIVEILAKLKISPLELVRKNESIWKENFKDKTLTDEEIIQSMADYPQLIERPIVIVGDKAVIGRPTEKIKELLGIF